MQQSAVTAENTPAKWEGIITDLSSKQAAVKDHAQRLLTQQAELALEVLLGDDGAKKKLDRIHAELEKVTSEAGDYDAAIAQAKAAQQEATRAEAERAEEARLEQMSKLSLDAIASARQLDGHLEQAVVFGTEVKDIIGAMLQIASKSEALGLTKLLEKGVFQRAAESHGLRSLIEFEPARVKQSEITSLASTLENRLANWLPTKESK